eukprot:TRINITY_DN25535_c1_g1_i1.p3 TRINITY_DN25535_c1_g1~~TRINITY_DN25535_c1_g1_i1.p3  ORF type:complete len:160 (+),score=17.47 TRINITY_DN25535_c1_g1_i1:256-735(+)
MARLRRHVRQHAGEEREQLAKSEAAQQGGPRRERERPPAEGGDGDGGVGTGLACNAKGLGVRVPAAAAEAAYLALRGGEKPPAYTFWEMEGMPVEAGDEAVQEAARQLGWTVRVVRRFVSRGILTCVVAATGADRRTERGGPEPVPTAPIAKGATNSTA